MSLFASGVSAGETFLNLLLAFWLVGFMFKKAFAWMNSGGPVANVAKEQATKTAGKAIVSIFKWLK